MSSASVASRLEPKVGGVRLTSVEEVAIGGGGWRASSRRLGTPMHGFSRSNHQTILSPQGVLNAVGDIRQLLHNTIGACPWVVQLARLSFWDNRRV